MQCDYITTTIEALAKEAYNGWKGEVGKERAEKLRAFIPERLDHYSLHLGIDKEKLLRAWEENRRVNAVNHYQECRYPDVSSVHVFKSLDEFKARFSSGKFRCPACSQETSNPYECNSGHLNSDDQACDWKSYGFLGTLGKGVEVIVLDDFIKTGAIHSIFSPVELEGA